MNEKICKKFPTDDAKESLMLESVMVGKRHNVGIWIEDEAIKYSPKSEKKLIKHKVINCHMEEVSEKGGA